ncbi:MAG: hypothetical protein HYZ45_13805 [Burkholderiales bacterium]|nr:hypothetical protein [Burkholderiales bacterium]
MLAASDVCLWRVKLPALPASKLKLALPNLVEEQLLSNPAECIVLANPGPADAEGLHSVAIVQRSWLEQIQQQLRTLGARKISAYPAQLCLEVGEKTLAVLQHDDNNPANIELTLCRPHADRLGLPLWASQSAVQEALATLRSLVPEQPLQLMVAANHVAAYQAAVDSGIEVQADSWPRWVAGAKHCKLDLMAAIAGGSEGAMDWGRWRWPLVLLALIAMIHIVSLNVEYLVYPKEIESDALLQMTRNINAAKLASGQGAPDDFTTMMAVFGDTWQKISTNRKVASIANIEYKERTLTIKWKDDSELPTAEAKVLFANRHLLLNESAAKVWQIKLGK